MPISASESFPDRSSTDRVAPNKNHAVRPFQWFLAAAFLIAIFAGVYSYRQTVRFGARATVNRPETVAEVNRIAIAVLPFTNVGGDSDTDYLSDGITETLISDLAHIPQFKVRSRDSVFRYKGKDPDVQTAGAALAASILVSGRVKSNDGTIEISTELTNVRDNTEIWGHRYSGRNSDLLGLQGQITADIAEKLRASLNTSTRLDALRQNTQDPEAYSLYLQGRYAWNQRTLNAIKAAISYFNQALARDPAYALAYSGLADAYSVRPVFGTNPSEDFPKSNAAARKAIELDPTLARPHAVLGMNEMEYDWDFAGGESEFKKAIELDPNDPTAHQWYAEKLSVLGRHKEALEEINRAQELDPLSPVIARVKAGTLMEAGQTGQGIALCQQLARENPAFAIAHDCLFYAYWNKGLYPQAIEETRIYAQLTGNPEDRAVARALDRGFRSGGWSAALTQIIVAFENRRKVGYASPFIIARFYADRHDKDKAFQWLDIAYREHDPLLIELNTWSQFDPLRSDPRFPELLSKIGLPKLP